MTEFIDTITVLEGPFVNKETCYDRLDEIEDNHEYEHILNLSPMRGFDKKWYICTEN